MKPGVMWRRIVDGWNRMDPARRRFTVVAAVALIGLFATLSGTRWYRPTRAAVSGLTNRPRVESHAPLLRAAGAEFDIDPNLLAGLMLAESGGHVGAVSHADALGLLQLMLPTAQEMAQRMGLEQPSRKDLLRDAELNIRLGARYLKWLDEQFDGQLEAMLVAYNMGKSNLKKKIAEAGSFEAWIAERRASGESGVATYVDKVLREREVFRERGHIVPNR